jgi:hypothetical protein
MGEVGASGYAVPRCYHPPVGCGGEDYAILGVTTHLWGEVVRATPYLSVTTTSGVNVSGEAAFSLPLWGRWHFCFAKMTDEVKT